MRPANVEALPSLTVDEPTFSMTFEVNTSPFLGAKQIVTSPANPATFGRESIHNVALRVRTDLGSRTIVVFGRGELLGRACSRTCA